MPPKNTEKPSSAEAKTADGAKPGHPARQRDLDAAISSITKAYGEGSIMRLGDAHAQIKIEVIPTGALAVDLARIPVAGFRPNRTQRRTMRVHATLDVVRHKLAFNAEHYALYLRYQRHRHPGGGMDQDSREQYQHFLLHSNVATELFEFRDGHELPGSPHLDPADTPWTS